MQPSRRHDVGLDEPEQRLEHPGAGAHLIGQRRQAERHAFTGVALGLPVQWLVLPVLLEQHHGEQVRSRPAARDGVEGAPAPGVMLSQARQEKRSRTVWITVQLRGTTSSVSVTSSPIFDRRVSPQHGQALGPGTTTRTRGRWAGKSWREGFRRSAGAGTAALTAAFSAARASAVAEASSSSSCSSYWSIEALRALGTLAIERAGELGDLEPEMGNQRRVTRQPGLHGGSLGLGAIGCGLGFIGALGGLIGSGLGGRESRAQRLDVDDLWLGALCHEESGS